MASAIDVNVPPQNSPVVSANLRANFVIAASEITGAQNAITTLQTTVSTLLFNVGALQTKTTVSGDGSLAANGQFRATGLQGRPVSTLVPTGDQVLGWSSVLNQWMPTTITVSGGGILEAPTVPAGSQWVRQGSNGTWQPALTEALADGRYAAEAPNAPAGSRWVRQAGGTWQAAFTQAQADLLYAPIGGGPTAGPLWDGAGVQWDAASTDWDQHPVDWTAVGTLWDQVAELRVKVAALQARLGMT